MGELKGPLPPEDDSLRIVSEQIGSLAGVKIMYSSVNLSTPEGKDAVARIITGEPRLLWDEAPVTIQVSDAVSMQAEEIDLDTGEVVSRWKLLLVSAAGEVWMTSSPVAASYMSRLASVYGKLPWKPERSVEFKRVKTRGKKECLICTVPTSTKPASPTPRTS